MQSDLHTADGWAWRGALDEAAASAAYWAGPWPTVPFTVGSPASYAASEAFRRWRRWWWGCVGAPGTAQWEAELHEEPDPEASAPRFG